MPLLATAETAGVSEVLSAGQGSWSSPRAALPVLGTPDASLVDVAVLGAGRIELLADSSTLENQLLADADDAALGLALAGPVRRHRGVEEGVHGYGSATGLAALPSRWKWALLGLLLAALTGVGARFRRLAAPDPEGVPGPAAAPRARRRDRTGAGPLRPPGEAAASVREHALRQLRPVPVSTREPVGLRWPRPPPGWGSTSRRPMPSPPMCSPTMRCSPPDVAWPSSRGPEHERRDAGAPPADRSRDRGRRRRPARGDRSAADSARARRPRAHAGSARGGQEPAGGHLRPHHRRGVPARAVHARHAPLRPHGHDDPAVRGAGLPARAGVRQRAPGRRDQPHPAQDPVGPAGGDAGATGLRGRPPPRAAGSVPGRRHPEPDRVRGHLPAPRGPARPLPGAGDRRLSRRARGADRAPAAAPRRGLAVAGAGPRGARPAGVAAGPGNRRSDHRLGRGRGLRGCGRSRDTDAAERVAGGQPARRRPPAGGLQGPRPPRRPGLRHPRRRGRDGGPRALTPARAQPRGGARALRRRAGDRRRAVVGAGAR